MAETYSEILKRLQEQLLRCSIEDLLRMQGQRESFLLLDVREADEFRAGHLPGAQSLSRGFLELQIEALSKDREQKILLYCGSGVRSLFAAEALGRMGYRQAYSVDGGIDAWKQAGLPVEKPLALSDRDRQRYQRHLSIPEVGTSGQLALLKSRVLLVGAGGLGSPAAYYLAAAGVGKLGILDNDKVERSNLQRQILHRDDAVGHFKVDSALSTLSAFNPDIQIKTHRERLNAENVERLFQDYDLIVDGTDNFPTRYLINDACVKLGLACVHGSVFRFEGQVTLFDPGNGGPCYRCLYPEPPPPELAPSCAEAGVLGVLPGVIGLLQAVEAVKYLLRLGTPLTGRLLHYDALRSKFQEYFTDPDPACAYCGKDKSFPGYVDYVQFCASKNG